MELLFGGYKLKPIRIGVIGAGVMGERHLKTYLASEGVDVKYIVDLNELKVASLEHKYDIGGETSYKKIIDEVDAVSIVTPTKSHFSIANFFISNGKHVLLEKPITGNLIEASQLIKSARENDIIFAIGHIERFNPMISYIKELLTEKKPLFIDIHREGPFDPRINDSDVISDLMIHDIDLLFHLLKESFEVKSASGLQFHTSLDDIVSAQLLSEKGTLINLISSRATDRKSRSWKLVFADESVYVDLLNLTVVSSKKGKKTTLNFKKSAFDLLSLEIQDFIESINSNDRPKTTGEEGRRALELSSRIQNEISSSALNLLSSSI